MRTQRRPETEEIKKWIKLWEYSQWIFEDAPKKGQKYRSMDESWEPSKSVWSFNVLEEIDPDQ